MGDRDRAIDELLAKQEITEAIFKYCRSMDRCDHELGKSVFHPDARVDYGAQMYQGSGYGFVDMALSGHTGAFLSHSHQHGNILIRIDGDRAYSETYGHVTLRRRDEAGQLIDCCNFGRYLDIWERRQDGRWKIAERAYLTDLDETGPAVGAIFETTSKRDPSDPSYRLFEQGKLLPLD
jgi:ketosteroid isomerase-like protein